MGDPHDLAALLRQQPDPLGRLGKVVQARLGHSSAKTTLDVYAHLFPDEEDRTRAAVDLALGAPADTVRTAAATER